MKRLGELLLERGAIDINELHTGLEACHRLGGRLGTQLLRFGFVTEKDLLEALSKQYGVPFIPEVVLLKASMEVRRTIPLEAARKYQAVPFDKVHGRLVVAMANPRDPGAIDELAALSELHIEACVATESAILKALEEVDSDIVEFEEVEAAPVVMPTVVTALPEWENLWSAPALRPSALLSLKRAEVPEMRRLVATFPGLTPVSEDGAADPHAVHDVSSFREALANAEHRDHVADAFLRFAAAYLGRLALFAVHRNKVVGWMARGQSVVTEDVESLEIPLNVPSIFFDANRDGQPYVGPIHSSEANRALVECLGDPAPREVVVLPISVKDRTVAFLVADIPGEAALAVPINELMEAANLTNVAFEILILRKKIVS